MSLYSHCMLVSNRLISEQLHLAKMEMNKEALRLKRKLEKVQEKKVSKPDIDEERVQSLSEKVTCSDAPVSIEEILSEYFLFLRNLPIMPDLEKQRLIDLVKNEWGIAEIIKSSLKPENLVHLKNGSNLSDRLSAKIGQSLRVIAPPVKICLLCNEKLSVSNYPTQIVVHTLTGPRIHSKYILKCQRCRLIDKSKFNPLHENRRQAVFYHPDRFGNMQNGYMFYKQDVQFIKASNEVFLEKDLVESAMSNFMHGFMSMESAAEAYNETFRNSDSVKLFKEFFNKNPKVGNHFNEKLKENNADEDIDIPLSDHFNEKEAEENGYRVQNGMHELHKNLL